MNCNNTEKFISKSKKIHSNKYDYSQTEYISNKTKVKIICPSHGAFLQSPNRHLEGREGCSQCNSIKKRTMFKKNIEDFIYEANLKHDKKYDYSKVNYVNSKTKIQIMCPNHGAFMQLPSHHLRGHGCPACANCLPLTKAIYVKRANSIHGFKYKYNFEKFYGLNHKIEITCDLHGLFLQSALNHLLGSGCPKCQWNKKLNTKEFLEECFKIHGNKYDYSKVEYVNNKTKIQIICPCHGSFFQLPWSHRGGSGCQKCKSSHGERLIRQFLEKNNINFLEQVKFDTCKNIRELPFDFYLCNRDILIEYQGEQHFPPKSKNRMFGASNANKQYELIAFRDKIKLNWCLKNNKKLIVISYKDISRVDDILRIHIT